MNHSVRAFLLLSALLAVSAAGCGRGKPSPVDVRLADGGWLDRLCKNPLPIFAEVHPEIHVITDASDADADVVILDSFALSEAIHKNELVNFLPRMEEQSFDLRQFKDADIRQAGRTGGFYALPIGGGGPAVILFNEDLFEKDKVLLPDKRWEWLDFLDAAKKLTKDLNNDGKPDQYGFFLEPNIEALLPWIWQAAGTAAKWDDPKAIKGIQFYADLARKHRVSPDLPTGRPAPGEVKTMSPMKLFIEGRLAMALGGPECVKALKSVTFKWDIQVPPRGPECSATTLRQFFCAARNETKHPDEAWQVMNFLSSSFVGVGVVQSDMVPARAELFTTFDFGGEGAAWNRTVWGSAYDIANHIPFLLAYDERHGKRIAPELVKLLVGEASAEETAKAIVQIAEDIRKKIE